MKRLINRASYRAQFAYALEQSQFLRDATQGNDPTDTIASWLQRLKRLHGVPFNYLIPNSAMLPNESIRFFSVDFNWLFALIEGACSIGQSTATDAALHKATTLKLRDTATTGDVASGFVMRSQVVSGWPQLEVLAFDKADVPLTNVLRMDRITDSILLFLCEGAVDHVIIREPAIGLHFGIETTGGKPLRYVTVPASAPKGTQPGDQIACAPVTPQFRDQTHRTIQMNKLAVDLSAALYAQKADNASDGSPLAFTSAEYALQLVEGTQQVTFQNTQGKDK